MAGEKMWVIPKGFIAHCKECISYDEGRCILRDNCLPFEGKLRKFRTLFIKKGSIKKEVK